MKNITGATCETAESLFIGAGAFFKNYDFKNDTYETAMAAGKGLGATQGGGSFSAVPTIEEIPIDGADPIPRIVGWVVTMLARIIESKPGTFALALSTGVVKQEGATYYSVKARRHISLDDYIENITYVGSVSGSNDPLIIQIFNAISTSGLTIETNGNVGSAMDITFTSRVDVCKNPEFSEYAPFEIFYPKQLAVPVIKTVTDADEVVTGTGVKTATVHIAGEGIPQGKQGTVDSDGNWSIQIPMLASGTIITAWQEFEGRKSPEVTTIVKIAE